MRCRVRSPCLDGDDLDEVFQPSEVGGVAGAEAGAVGVGGGGDQQVHGSAAGLASGIDHGGGEASGSVPVGRLHQRQRRSQWAGEFLHDPVRDVRPRQIL